MATCIYCGGTFHPGRSCPNGMDQFPEESKNVNNCPACNRAITDSQLLCDDHWELVPEKLREPIRKLKKTRGTAEWKSAVSAAVQHVNAKLADEKELDSYVSSMGE